MVRILPLDLSKCFYYTKLALIFKTNDIASQGLKYEDAITEQLISAKKILSEKDVVAFNKNMRWGINIFELNISSVMEKTQ